LLSLSLFVIGAQIHNKTTPNGNEMLGMVHLTFTLCSCTTTGQIMQLPELIGEQLSSHLFERLRLTAD
jgi:hypothetical protein